MLDDTLVYEPPCPCGAGNRTKGPAGAKCFNDHLAPFRDGRLSWPSEARRQLALVTAPQQPLTLPPEVDTWPARPGSAAFAGLAGRVVDLVEPHSEADPMAVLVTFLTAFGNAVGSAPHAAVGATVHHARDNAVLVGKSAKARKGDSWPPVARLFEQADPAWTKQCVGSGLSTGEGLIWAVRDRIEKPEPIKEKGVITGYQPVVVDEGVSDKRLLVLESEFGRTLKVMDRQGNTLSPVVRQAWDTGALRVMTRAITPVATGAHISILGHVTLEELQREMEGGEATNGFANRFLWIAVRRSKKLADPPPFVGAHVERVADELRFALDAARRIGRMERDAEAREMWESLYDDLSEDREGMAGSILARAEPHVLRLSLLYALLDRSAVVTVAHLQSAVELWGYSEMSVHHIFGDATGDGVADTIWAVLRQNNRMTRGDISELLGRNVSSARIDAARNTLMHLHRIEVSFDQTGGRGRPPEVWSVAA